ncbi:MAG: CBS domain-containing protein [Desulfobacteraceae bacterium]|uniref:CBS domain-containing protein n=1 Tax=Candidatus Desulfacyla euxinica TaxID=2841693 RepID=A0A8J6T8Y8_9DELT|nr:CBS domain-containing protein [Candidatus Desulfacyla euxinica]MBL6978689.1 CBS domain-containing protein [Desulfobacteraceae bacterium]MBL7216782.1 CBS domain-containing protein [Desulfobacteraceae bacterium]
MLNASDIMTTDVITVKKDTSLKDLAKILYKNHINGVPVVDEDGSLLGVICESDLIRKDKKLHIPTVVAIFDAVVYLESPKSIEKEFKRISATTVEDLYTKKTITVDERTPIDEIATIMTKKKIYTIPVMDGDLIVGVIGKADLLRTIVGG